MNIGVSLIFIIKLFAPPRHDGFASKVFNKAPTLLLRLRPSHAAEASQFLLALEATPHLHTETWPGRHAMDTPPHRWQIPKQEKQGDDNGGIERPTVKGLDALGG